MTSSRLQTLDIRLLRYFAVVAEENNISRAARRLFISQPPLSRHIRHLETLLGVTLFVRHTKGLILTAEGERVLELIRPLLALQETTLSALGQLSDDRQQPLRLGLTTAFEQGILRLWNRRWVARPVRFPSFATRRLPLPGKCAKAS